MLRRPVLLLALLASAPAYAGDPLDDVSGTESWEDKTRAPRHRRRASDDPPQPAPSEVGRPAPAGEEKPSPAPLSRDAAENAADHERYKAERREFDLERDQSVAIKKGRVGSFFKSPPVIETVKAKPKPAPRPKTDAPEATLEDEERRLEEKANRALAGKKDAPPAQPEPARAEPATEVRPPRPAADPPAADAAQ